MSCGASSPPPTAPSGSCELYPWIRRADRCRYADADTIVADPSVAVHQLLPPPGLSPEPLLLGSQDHNGLNAGVLLMRVAPASLRFLEDLISDTKRPGGLSDQHYTGWRLRTDPAVSDHFYEIPKHWLNAYWLSEVTAQPWRPAMHVHLVNWLSDKVPWRPAVRHATRIARDARKAYADAYNVRGAVRDSAMGFELLPQYKLAAESAHKWWAQAVGGVRKMRFLDESEGGRRVDGDEYDEARRFVVW